MEQVSNGSVASSTDLGWTHWTWGS